MAITVDEAGRRGGIAVLRSRERAYFAANRERAWIVECPRCHRDMRVVGWKGPQHGRCREPLLWMESRCPVALLF